MLSVFIAEDALKKICIEEMEKDPIDQSVWFKIFCAQSEISVSSDNETDVWDEEDPLFIFSQSYNVDIPYDTEYIKSIYYDHNQVLKNTCGLYILDVSEDVAKEIQKKYGVICVSTASMKTPLLCKDPISKSPEEGQSGIGWRDVICDYRNFPSNSILIVDRYLVANDSFVDGADGKIVGRNNIFEILNNLLPSSFSGNEYHVTIIVDEDQIKNGLTFSRLATSINQLKGRLSRNYIIKIDLIAMKAGSAFHEITHHRRVISNYYILKADQKLSAFDNNVSLCDQEITIKALYSEGLSNSSDIPEKMHKRWLDQFHDYYEYLKKIPNPVDCSIAVNGNCRVDSSKLGNRILGY